MKRKTLFGIAFAVLALAGLGSLAVFITVENKNETLASAEADAETALKDLQDSMAASSVSQQEPENETGFSGDNSQTESVRDEVPHIIWVGDSRTVGMQKAVENNDSYIAMSGEGYYWFEESGVPLLRTAISRYPDSPVVYNFGVNDHENLDNYLNLYRSLEQEYPDTHFYYLSVNPVDSEACEYISNEDISEFNGYFQKDFPGRYIDSFSYLMANDTVTLDGIHYSGEDYQKIFDFASEQVIKLEEQYQ